jgi:hypothetical protein
MGFTAGLLGVAFVLSLVNLLPTGLGESWRSSQSNVYTAFWPQGWSFFAEQPIGGVLVAYRLTPSGHLGEMVTHTLGSAENSAGLDRGGYTRLLEIQLVAAGLSAATWHDCAGTSPELCLAAAPESRQTVANKALAPTLCGPTALAMALARPAAGRSDEDTGPPISRMAAVNVSCR